MMTALAWLTAFMMGATVIIELFVGMALAMAIGIVFFAISLIGFIVNWQYRPEEPED